LVDAVSETNNAYQTVDESGANNDNSEGSGFSLFGGRRRNVTPVKLPKRKYTKAKKRKGSRRRYEMS
jgi:hypothetical protein